MSFHANGGGGSGGEIPPKTYMPSYQPGHGVNKNNPLFQKTKSIVYGTSDQIYSASSTIAVDAPSSSMPQLIELVNNGRVPLNILVGYETYEDETTDSGATRYLHIMLMPGEVYYPSVRAVISTEAASTQFDGTALENDAPSSVNSGLLWKDSDANLAAHVRPSETDPITITVGSNETNYFRAGDLIQIGRGTSQTDITEATYYREILRVQSITDTEDMVCERALYGTDAGDYDEANWSVGHAIGQPIYLPFFNAYHDTDKFSVAQTDSNGKFKCSNFFGQGRAVSGVQGIVPGSVAIKFYQPGYQNLGLSGITSSTNSGLTASTAYKIDITVDGGTLFQDLTFTTDSSNLNFGGTSGIISLIQSALDTQYYTAGNLFEKKVTVGIVNGDIRFTSGSHLSTSAILLADTGDSGSFIDATANGRIPASANIPDAVAARLPDDVLYDRITYSASPNTGAFGYDDGNGNLAGMCNGTINYETGAVDMTGCPPNAEFVYTVAHSSGFSGKLNTGANAIVEILANTPSQKWNGSVKLSTY